MNKTKKDKYLRKNRDNEYRKHKTRRIQYGGVKIPFTKLESSGSTSNKEEEIQATRKAALAVAQKLETEADKQQDPVIKNELLAKAARLKSIAEEEPDPGVVLIPKGAKNGLLGWFSSFFKKSQQNLPIEMSQVALTDEMPEIIKDTKEKAELVRKINRVYKNRIKKILSDIYQRSITKNTDIGITPEESLEIDNLLKQIYGNSEMLNKGLINPSQVSHAELSGNFTATESVGQQPQSQSPQSNHGDPHKSPKQQPPPGAAAAAEIKAQAKASEAAAKAQAKASEAAAKAQAKAAAEAEKVARKAQVKTAADAHKAKQLEIDKKSGITRVKGIVGRASDSLKKTLTTNPFNKTPKKTDPENTSESEPLLGDSSRSNDSNDSATQKKSWRESASARLKTAKNAVISTKDALLNRITRKKRDTQNPEGSAIEMQEMNAMKADSSQPTSSANSSQTPPSPAEVATPYNPAAPTRAPPPPPTNRPPVSTPDPSSIVPQTEPSPRARPPPPPRPTSFPPSVATENTIPNGNWTKAAESAWVPGAQDGGNITRKNRQYIHEIKNNRTHLFNKEMEIINSIRNFKHGHGPNEHGKNKPENIQKKFIKVIKRS